MRLFFILAICNALAYGRNTKLRFSIPKCPRKSPTTVQCILNGIEMIRPNLKMGIPEINVPRLEPFKMKHLELDAELPGLILKGEASNIVAFGSSEFIIKSLKVDLDNYFMEATIVIPNLEVTADYDSTGSKVFLIETSGSGQFKGIFNTVTANIRGNGHAVMKDGLEYVKVDDITASIKFGGGTLHIDPDNKSFKAKTAAKFINSSSGKILNKIAPVINKAAAPIIKKYITKILNVVPLNNIFSW